MCGRYAVVSRLKIIEKEFNAGVSEILDRFEFNPNVSPSLAKFLMANMGTQGVNTKGLASFTDRISVRRPKYVSDTVTPQQVNFTLPTRT